MTDTSSKVASVSQRQEEEVVAFLREHLDFLARNPDLLMDLVVPHLPANGTVSLIERQVQLLRERCQNGQDQLQELLATARQNERLADRLHRIAVEAASIGKLDEVLDTVPALVQEIFDVDYATVRIDIKHKDNRAECVDGSDPQYQDLRARVAHGQCLCENRLGAKALTFLFGNQGRKVKSCVLIPLGGRRPVGVFALGSRDGNRFQPEMGTLYLDRLGEILGAVLQRLAT